MPSRCSVTDFSPMSLRPPTDIAPQTLIANHASGGELKWENLTETEKSAASLGVHPEAWKPIAFMNTVHYDTLLKSNAIDESLAKQLEAYKVVAAGQA